ncbi:hypothetical protein [Clostridium perfringens]|uniref:hypothetical protein n=1 Tax=Clostridium perfringens TaxID=1502 RepID=UPI0024BD38BE|nr:hypothetical protein [Clostridium perfringens]
MNKEKLQKKLEEIKYKMEQHGAIGNYIVCGFIAIGIVFFLSSNLLLNKEVQLISTPLNKVLNLNDIELSVTSREFNPENNLIQFNVKIKNFIPTDEKTLSVELREKKNPQELIETNLVKVSNEDYIVYAKLPKNWSAVSLTFIENDKEINSSKNKIKIYSDSRDITINNALREKNKEGLTVELVENDIEKIKEEIKNKENEITHKNKEIENFNAQISTLEKEKEYQTETEITETDSKINTLKTDIENKKKEIENLKNNINELNQKIEKLNKKKSDLLDLVK